MNDYNLLDLFRREIETQVDILKESLATLKTQPSSMTDLERATQAVHSIWGSARLVDREVAANLAQIMKDCFLAVQNKTVTLGEEQIDVLLHGSHLLLSIGKTASSDFEHWMSEHSWELTTTQKTISIILKSEITNTSSPSKQEVVTISPSQNDSSLNIEENIEKNINADIVETVTESSLHTSQQSTLPEITSPLNPWDSTNVTTVFADSPNSSVSSTAMVKDPPKAIALTADSSMVDLFRLEVETQVGVMNDSLLALEGNPQSAQALESLMRAAHSIKGSARIVALDAVVGLAHVMEDCFVAAQNKTITLLSAQVDILLQGVDLLQGISNTDNSELPNWLGENQAVFAEVQSAVTAILNPQAAVLTRAIPKSVESVQPLPTSSLVVETEKSNSPVPLKVSEGENEFKPVLQEKNTATSATEPAPTQDRVVRVNAENLNRIMGLAGESLIEANWLQPHADSMMSLKWNLVDLSRTLEQLEDALDRSNQQQSVKQHLQEARTKEQQCLDLLSDRLNELELYAQRTANLSDRLYREVITSNMRPFADGIQSFPRMIRDLARKLDKQVKLDIVGKATSVDRDILKKLEAPLTHILRNATDHGIEMPSERIEKGKPPEGTIRLEAFHRGGMLVITIADDGKGINLEQLRQKVVNKNLATPEMAAQFSDAELMEFLFLPGFSTAKQVTEISGRGVGLDIAKSMAQEVGGTVRAVSQVEKGTSFHFQLPLTLSVVRTLLVEISGRPYAIPLARIEQIVIVEPASISEVENRQYFTMNQQNIGLISAHQVLELPESTPKSGDISVVVISDQSNVYGLVVDKFLGERDLVVRPLDARLGKVRDISATSLLGDGSPVLIVDVTDMVRTMDAILNAGQLNKLGTEATSILDKPKKVLVVDDSITVREMERKLLENRGYQVDIAVDGMEGWNAVRTNHYDLVISDIDMPRMNGIELVRQIKNHSRLHSLPVIIMSYRDRTEDRIQGMEAGADYYLTKSSFHDDTLVNAVVDLVGR
jgi:two-component system, chemotaxis family, sensor histidine kinase and response regulator WspE